MSSVVEELERRKKDYLAHDVRSLPEYREKVNREFPRIVVACDEVAEMLDKAGKTKERKENIEKIESYLSTIARQDVLLASICFWQPSARTPIF